MIVDERIKTGPSRFFTDVPQRFLWLLLLWWCSRNSTQYSVRCVGCAVAKAVYIGALWVVQFPRMMLS